MIDSSPDGDHLISDFVFSDEGEAFIAEAGFHGFGDDPLRSPSPQIIQIRPDGTERVVYENTASMDDIRRADSSDAMPDGIDRRAAVLPPGPAASLHRRYAREVTRRVRRASDPCGTGRLFVNSG